MKFGFRRREWTGNKDDAVKNFSDGFFFFPFLNTWTFGYPIHMYYFVTNFLPCKVNNFERITTFVAFWFLLKLEKLNFLINYIHVYFKSKPNKSLDQLPTSYLFLNISVLNRSDRHKKSTGSFWFNKNVFCIKIYLKFMIHGLFKFIRSHINV